MVVARAGEEADTDPAPQLLRPFFRFARLPPAALDVVHRVVEQDEDFRARVAGLADEDALGRASWLWLVRPDGWSEELDAMTAAEQQAVDAAREEREERTARRQLDGAQHARRRAEDEAAQLRAEAADARIALGDERRARKGAEDEAARLGGVVAEAETQLAEQRRRAKTAEDRLQDSRAEAARLRARVRELEEGLREATAAAEGAVPAPASAPVPAPASAPSPRWGEQLPREALSAAVRSAAEAAERLSSALADASRLLGPDAEAPAAPGGPPDRGRPARRRPTSLPPAVLDDSEEAAAHLVRVDRMVLLVDGYNAAKLAWPSEPLPEQRGRLVDALAELAARTGTRPHVVFDGAGGPASPRPVSRPVQVTFSPAGVEADAVVLELVDLLPRDQPVVVASSDREVQDGARQRGANVISSAQLLAVLRR